MTLRFNMVAPIGRFGGLYFGKRYPELWRVRLHYVVIYGIFAALSAYFLAWSIIRLFDNELLDKYVQEYIDEEFLLFILILLSLLLPIYWVYWQLKLSDPSINRPRFSVIKTTLLSWICLVILCVFPFVFISKLAITPNNFMHFNQEEVAVSVLVSFCAFFLVSVFLSVAASTGQKIAYIGIALALVLTFILIFVISEILQIDSGELIVSFLLLFHFCLGFLAIRQKNLLRKSGIKYALVVAFLMLTPFAISLGNAYLFFEIFDVSDSDIYENALIISAGPVLYLMFNTYVQRLLHRLRTLPA